MSTIAQNIKDIYEMKQRLSGNLLEKNNQFSNKTNNGYDFSQYHTCISGITVNDPYNLTFLGEFGDIPWDVEIFGISPCYWSFRKFISKETSFCVPIGTSNINIGIMIHNR